MNTHSLDDKQAKNPVEEFPAFLTLWAALSQALPLSAYDPHYHREQCYSTAYMKRREAASNNSPPSPTSP
ncbi:hypothetical protein AV530_019675 [Patagioenas fasciata monilis]|uniref:Uncharacterized protein n=1 Tax=Patagioenas fasciata monilis TaxID=372326 RepID=A0A1V4JEF7_PATFA|nr:hypothetical protein AV530_019675 [Patagioenas fasciata monilis]